MPREIRLVRRVTAQAGGWAGDGADWSQASPPIAAGGGAETTSPIFVIPLSRADAPDVRTRGAAGIMRVTGADAARRFNMQVFVSWARREGATITKDWRLLTDTAAREIGNGEDFDTGIAANLQDCEIAFHLIPIGGNLAEASVVEIWAAEV